MLPAASALAALIHPELGEAATRWVAQDEFRDDALRRRDAARAELRGFLGSPRSPLPKKQEVLAIVREMYDGEAGVGYVPTLFRPTYGLVEAIGNLVGSEARAFFARDYPTHKRPQHIQAFPKAL